MGGVRDDATGTRDRRHQEQALFHSRLVALRRALNLWWERTEDGESGGAPEDLIAIRSRLSDAVEQMEAVKRLRRAQ
ncbi:hypothetical protein UFOVP1124_43 [uncultured Caudovirales phage]|uniref:Uncharacterized protein n=1 Tax=uncultured Caudovirales phage TaxID=2100421 RepID=A0A6J5QVV5_9CAUD|nr:hypothetical protein UFOVP1124_43 [uncultured Caudovirales phage]